LYYLYQLIRDNTIGGIHRRWKLRLFKRNVGAIVTLRKCKVDNSNYWEIGGVTKLDFKGMGEIFFLVVQIGGKCK
jgi:hypothetical protein